jgi:hypothetical protein
MPIGPDASEHWQIVRGALEDAGITDIRPAPMPAQNFIPRQLRRSHPLLCSAEV